MDDESHPNHNQHLEGDPLSGNSFTYAQQFRSHPHLNSTPHPQSQPLQRRPRGFAAANAAPAPPVSTPCSAGGGITAVGAEKGRREREKEKERTKLRERHRRAITSRMLAGLRQYGNFQLPARADMNDVLAALARQAGWVVETDGTTYRDFAPPSSPPAKMTTYLVRSAETPISTSSFKNRSTKASFDRQASAGQINQSLSPASLDSIVVTDCSTKSNKYTSSSANSFGSPDCLEADEFIQDVPSFQYHSDFLGTPSVPVYIMLSRGIINNYCQLVDPEGVREELKHLKLLHVDGVAVECWWGIVEGWDPQKYSWAGYRELFMVLREVQLNVQVVMSFYALGGIDSTDLFISLPEWVLDIGKDNQDIFFTDREGQRNTNCLSWGIDKERVLRGRTGLEVYYDLMRSFRMEFDDLFAEGLITTVDIGLGASGELKFPSFSEIMGWRYPGIGEFQCYDRYLQQKLQKAAKLRGHPYWARGPDNAGHYNSRTHETGFFCDQGDYDSCYGRFFLRWYAQTLISHADDVLSWARLAFEDTQISVKIPAIYWWYKTASHAAELTAGYYNSANRDGYLPILNVLQKHSVVAKLTTPTFHVNSQEYSEGSSADPEGLRWQFMNTAWDMGITIAGQIEGPCNREEQRRVVEASKPRNDPDQRHFSFFVYQPPCSPVQRNYDLADLSDFVKSMHGKSG